MHNLNLIYYKESKLPLDNVNDFQINSMEPDVVYLRRGNSIAIVKNGSTDALIDFEEEVIGFEYLSLNDELCVATSTGCVHTYNIINGNREEVTYCDGGLECMKFSWDQEIVVFVTK